MIAVRKALLTAAAAGALFASPAAADAATPQENLDCVIWSSYRVGVATDDTVRNALMLATAWFIGLYEGQTGKTVDDDMIARGTKMTEAQVVAAEPSCIARFDNFGDRLTAIGQTMSSSGK